MSNDPGTKETLALLQRLRESITEFARRERQLQRTRDHLDEGRNPSSEPALAEEETQFHAETARQEADWHARGEFLAAWKAQRTARLKIAFGSARIKRLERIEAAKGREISAVQQGRITTAREKAAALQANDEHLAGLSTGLDTARMALRDLQRKARAAFRAWPSLNGQLTDAPADLFEAKDTDTLVEEFNSQFARVASDLTRFRKCPAVAFFGSVPLWLVLALLGVLASVPFLPGFAVLPAVPFVATAVVLAGAVLGWYLLGGAAAAVPGGTLARDLARLAGLYQACVGNLQGQRESEIARIESAAAEQLRTLDERWQAAVREAESQRAAMERTLPEKAAVLASRQQALADRRTAALESARASALATLAAAHAGRLREIAQSQDERLGKQRADNQARWREAEAAWAETLPPLFARLAAAEEAGRHFPDWEDPCWEVWTPPARFHDAVPFARIDADLPTLCEAVPVSDRFALPGPVRFSLPAFLRFPGEGSLLIETSRACGETVAGMLNGVILRLLAGSPPGRLTFTLLDPVGLGQNFAGLMHLADYEDSLIHKRIWTQPSEIEQRLSDLNKQIEKVIQLHLRNEYPTLRAYNEHAGNIAEKYHFLVVADFPGNFSETAQRSLVNLAVSGARCGVYLLLHWDRRHDVPKFVLDEIRRTSLHVIQTRDGFEMEGFPAQGVRLIPETLPSPESMTRFLRRVGEGWRNSNRIEVPFAAIVPQPDSLWSLNTAEELRVPIGRAGAAKLQDFALGRGTRQHVLIGGKTGSGKSTLFHVLVTNLALWYAPDEVEFYLVDFKKGVEFKCYATGKLPHARVIAIESDREFGLAVLQRVDAELRRRGDLFRRLGVQNLAAYRKASGAPLPRTLVLIDEFQEYFVEDDRIAQEANMLLDRIVRQGRAFGIHMVLGSQTLGGAYTLARATMGQMVIRIALQCNEADAQLIMDDNNPAPKFLTRPGEGIYNDMAGAVEGNSPFQTVWLSEDERDAHLAAIHKLASDRSPAWPAPFVFEGNAPANVADNAFLAELLRNPRAVPVPRVWLGEPNAIKGPTEVLFPPQSGSHLLIVGQAGEPVLAMLTAALVALEAQAPPEGIRLLWFDNSPPDSPGDLALQRLVAALPHPVRIVRPGDVGAALADLGGETNPPGTFLFLPAIQNFSKLRQEEDFGFSLDADESASPSKIFAGLIADGPARGIHILVATDTFNNVQRFLGRKLLTEFENRVLFQMNANDSAALIDSPRAAALGLHRAVLHQGNLGTLEIFRPYALPDPDWPGVAKDRSTARS